MAAVVLAVGALWAPAFQPGWASALIDIIAVLYLISVIVIALRARLDFLKPLRRGDVAPSLPGTVLIGVVFALLLAGFASGALFAASAKHGLYQPFYAPPSRLETLAFFINEALKGALFDVLDVFAVDVPGAPAYDPQRRWGFALVVILYRLAAAFAVWSLVFGFIARRTRRAGNS